MRLKTPLIAAFTGCFLLPLAWTACEPLDGCEYTATCPETGGASGSGGGGTAGALHGGAAGNPSGGATSGGRNDSGDAGGGGDATGAGGSAGAGGISGEGGAESAGTGGTEGGAGGVGGAPPCAGVCAPPTPVCDVRADRCVACAEDAHCSGATPACDAMAGKCVACTQATHCAAPLPACDVVRHECVACVANADCPAKTPVCNSATHSCVECLADADCPGTTPHCDVASHQCVECLEPRDCGDPAASRCSAGRCLGCAKDADCGHISGKNVCSAAVCVQCTDANTSACGSNSCDPERKRCTKTALSSVGMCQKCVSDRECMGGDQADPDVRCVPMTFAGSPRPEAFCLRRASKTCTRPFVQMPDALVSRSGAAAEKYCGVDQLSTRCEALLDLIDARTCSDGLATSCGCTRDADGACTAPGNGAICGVVAGSANHCTYPCGTVSDCPTGKTCTIDTPYCH